MTLAELAVYCMSTVIVFTSIWSIYDRWMKVTYPVKGSKRPGGLFSTLFVYFWRFYSFCLFGLMLYLLTYTISVFKTYKSDQQSVLDILVTCAIITGLKPCIAFVSLLLFIMGQERHSAMHAHLGEAKHQLTQTFGFKLHVIKLNMLFLACFFLTATMVIAIAIAEFGVTRQWEIAGEFPAGHGVYLAPLVTMFDMVPLFYYIQTMQAVQTYVRVTVENTICQVQKNTLDLREAYEQYKKFCRLSQSTSKFFGPWLLWSLTWTLLTVSLSLYFVTQPGTDPNQLPQEVLDVMAQSEQIANIYRNSINFNVTWTIMQILIAIMHLGFILSQGIYVNETSRQLVGIILNYARQRPTDPDALLTCKFTRKIMVQHQWGIGGWRVFTMERPLIFTMVSGVITYTLFMYRMSHQQKQPPTL